jgi:hypothetical protein
VEFYAIDEAFDPILPAGAPAAGECLLYVNYFGLKTSTAARLAAVFASDLGRAVETTEIAFAASELQVHLDWRLRECNYGELNGAPTADLDEQERLRRIDEPFPGGESYRQVIERTRSFLNELFPDRDGSRVLLIAHSELGASPAGRRRLPGRPQAASRELAVLHRHSARATAWRRTWLGGRRRAIAIRCCRTNPWRGVNCGSAALLRLWPDVTGVPGRLHAGIDAGQPPAALPIDHRMMPGTWTV